MIGGRILRPGDACNAALAYSHYGLLAAKQYLDITATYEDHGSCLILPTTYKNGLALIEAARTSIADGTTPVPIWAGGSDGATEISGQYATGNLSFQDKGSPCAFLPTPQSLRMKTNVALHEMQGRNAVLPVFVPQSGDIGIGEPRSGRLQYLGMWVMDQVEYKADTKEDLIKKYNDMLLGKGLPSLLTWRLAQHFKFWLHPLWKNECNSVPYNVPLKIITLRDDTDFVAFSLPVSSVSAFVDMRSNAFITEGDIFDTFIKFKGWRELYMEREEHICHQQRCATSIIENDSLESVGLQRSKRSKKQDGTLHIATSLTKV